MKFILSAIATVTLAVSLSFSAFAKDFKVGDITVNSAFIPATVKAAPVAAGYLTIINNGSQADRLVSVSANFSGKQEIHTMTMVEGIMRMRPLKDGIEIPAGEEAILKTGGDHLMFMKLNEQMEAGQMRKVTLVFEKAGSLEIDMAVVDMTKMDHKEDHSTHTH